MSTLFRPYRVFALQALVTCIASAPRVGHARFVVGSAVGTKALGWGLLSRGAAPGSPQGLPEWTSGASFLAGDGATFGTRFYLANVAHTSVAGQTPALRPDLWSLGAAPGAIPINPGDTVFVGAQVATFAGIDSVTLELDPVADFSLVGNVGVIDLQIRRSARPPSPVIDAPFAFG